MNEKLPEQDASPRVPYLPPDSPMIVGSVETAASYYGGSGADYAVYSSVT